MAKLMISYDNELSGYKKNDMVKCQVLIKGSEGNDDQRGILLIKEKESGLILFGRYNVECISRDSIISGYWTIVSGICINSLQSDILSAIHKSFPELRLKKYNGDTYIKNDNYLILVRRCNDKKN